jgi:capsid protein
LNTLDSIIAWLSPQAAVRRAQHRRVLAYYEAANPNRMRKGRTAPGTANVSVGAREKPARAGALLRAELRHRTRRSGRSRAEDGRPAQASRASRSRRRTRTAKSTTNSPRRSSRCGRTGAANPEVTWQHDWASCQRLLCRSWLRDGDVFAQVVQGITPFLDHGTAVPLSLEMIESDLVPLSYSLAPGIVHGVEINAWGRPLAYHILRQPPGDVFSTFAAPSDMKRVSADRILHVKMVDRIRQYRGVSVFASVLQRFDDLKDYEESERIAAKVAASMAAYIKKGAPDDYETAEDGDAEGSASSRSVPAWCSTTSVPARRSG